MEKRGRRESDGRKRMAAQRRKRKRRLKGLLRLLAWVLCLGFLIRTAATFERKVTSPTEDGEVDLSGLYSPYAILVEIQTGRIVGERQSDVRIWPASLTKIMTSLLLLEQAEDLEETTEIKSEIFGPLQARDASMAGFAPGEQVSLKDLLYGMLLPSGAECSVAVAQWAAGSEEEFTVRMNERARELGLADTHFANATGLQDENHYSTVRDLAFLLIQALKDPDFRAAFTAERYTSSGTAEHPEGIALHSTLFEAMRGARIEDDRILGGKTGYTAQAGLCLASLLAVDGKEYVLVTAGAKGNHYTDPYHVRDAEKVCRRLEKG